MSAPTESQRQLDYVGEELRFFELAENWKRYFAERLRPYVSGRVLEVGAGMGATAPYLYRPDLDCYLSLEPDIRLCDEYRRRHESGQIPAPCELVHGTLESLPEGMSFDSIVYIDVLEHIPDDRREFARAYDRLSPGGHLLVLCPAHGFLFSEFDSAIGHRRRYDKKMYRGLSRHQPVKLEYLDSVGMAASIGNKWILKRSCPNEKQIILWDRVLVRISRIMDPLLLRMIGKSILGVWKK